LQLIVSLCVLVYVVTVTVVGLRMLLLARRTHGVPELAIGAGSVLICGVGFPASVASGFGGVVEEVNARLWVASELVTQLGIVLLYVFTQQVFRPGVRWARRWSRASPSSSRWRSPGRPARSRSRSPANTRCR
jgi:hypothetical protein